MKDNINIIVLPLYRHEDSSPYYLFNIHKNSEDTLDLSFLETSLSKLSHVFNFNNISIDGGEISELSDVYFDFLFNIIKLYTNKIIVNTDFVKYNPSLINKVDVINVNLNFDKYQTNIKTIKNNIKAATSIGKIVNVNSLDVRLSDKSELENIVTLNHLGIKSWRILPYHQAENNPKQEPYNEFEKIIKKYLKLTEYMNFSFLNKLELDNVVKNDNFPIKTVYITPNNKFGLGVFDKNDVFHIQEFETIDSLEKNLKKLQSEQILVCKDCNFKVNCLANRFFNPNYVGKSCSGFKDLIKSMEGIK